MSESDIQTNRYGHVEVNLKEVAVADKRRNRRCITKADDYGGLVSTCCVSEKLGNYYFFFCLPDLLLCIVVFVKQKNAEIKLFIRLNTK